MLRTFVLLIALAAAPSPSTAAAQDMPPPAEVMAVPAELREALHEQGITSRLPAKIRLEKIVRFMFDAGGLGVRYRHDATHTVAETYRSRTANCLSFTLLTVALAREVGLPAYALGVENTLAWQQQGDLVYRTNHVYAGVDVHGRRYGIDVAEDTVLAGRFPEPMSDDRLVALYYNNRAAEIAAVGDMPLAQAHMAESLALDPTYATSWSNAGALHARTGDAAAAERDYLRALALDGGHAATLSNIVALYARTGDEAAMAKYRRRLARVEARDPFHHFQRALLVEKQQKFAEAARHYDRAIDLHGGEHRFHFGLARMQMALGQEKRARRSLERASALSRGDAHARYITKLKRMRSMRS